MRPITPKIEPITLSGQGSRETKPVELKSGLYNVNLTHSGSGNFVIWAVNRQGTMLDNLVNEIGTYDKLKPMNIKDSGVYTFDVTASADWTMTISEYMFGY